MENGEIVEISGLNDDLDFQIRLNKILASFGVHVVKEGFIAVEFHSVVEASLSNLIK